MLGLAFDIRRARNPRSLAVGIEISTIAHQFQLASLDALAFSWISSAEM
jgi:hypothetical protein